MCGITGFIDTRGGPGAGEEVLARMAGKLTYRGPDSAGCERGTQSGAP